jgi:uncharacterized small protein (DUF1192 family)
VPTPRCPFYKVSPREAAVALLEDEVEGVEGQLEATDPQDLNTRYWLWKRQRELQEEIARLRSPVRDLPLTAVYRVLGV